jgi:hypothetical protein
MEDILAQQLSDYEDLTLNLESLLDGLSESTNINFENDKKKNRDQLEDFKQILQSNKDAFKENAHKKDWAPVQEFRNAIKLQPHHFDSIEYPNVVEKVWQKVWEQLKNYEGMESFGLEQFFRIEKNDIYPDLPLTIRQKVSSMYTMLNYIGYRPDLGLRSDRGFRKAIHDQGHASIASGLDILFTCDDRMAAKCRAIYEYLGVGTKVVHMKRK